MPRRKPDPTPANAMAADPPPTFNSVFGTAQRPALPGQDPGRVEAIYDLLCGQLHPSDVIEQMWLADIAYLTARIEYFRAALSGYYAGRLAGEDDLVGLDEGTRVIQRAAREFVLSARRDNPNIWPELQYSPELSPLTPGDPAYTQKLGQVIDENLDTIVKLDEAEIRLLRERDRLIAQFDRRRHTAVRDAIESAQASQPALAAPETK